MKTTLYITNQGLELECDQQDCDCSVKIPIEKLTPRGAIPWEDAGELAEAYADEHHDWYQGTCADCSEPIRRDIAAVERAEMEIKRNKEEAFL